MHTTESISPFNALDRSIGRQLRARSTDDSDILELIGSFTSRALRQGHVCLDIEQIPTAELDLEKTNLSPVAIINYLKKCPSVGNEEASTRPLILSQTGKLYFHRYWHYERQLIGSIEQRIQHESDNTHDPLKQNSIPTNKLGEDQRRAVDLASKSNLSFISGGPGTGKTTIVLHILASLQASSRDTSLKVALAAPTGKAAQRIQESLTANMDSLQIPSATRNRISTEASTLHRLLGYQRNSIQFKYHESNPLPYDLVVVDEASMLDLLLFTKLLKALKPQTRLILLGDSHQLASVEAGSIFGDLTVASRTNPKLRENTVELNENYRFGNDSALYQVCEYIKAGDSENALISFSAEGEQLILKDLPGSANISSALERTIGDHFAALANTTEPVEALRLMAQICLLTPLRNGPYGVQGLNTTMEAIVRSRTGIPGNQSYFNGQPILISANSYSQGLFNGDLGIIMTDPEDPHSLFAYFPDNTERIKRYPLSALPTFESAYACTVHKSQGSEYKRVLFIVPPIDSPVLSRELVYTAISRSRENAEVWASPQSLKQAINQPTQRVSGILDAFS